MECVVVSLSESEWASACWLGPDEGGLGHTLKPCTKHSSRVRDIVLLLWRRFVCVCVRVDVLVSSVGV